MKYDPAHIAVLSQMYERNDITVDALAQDAVALAKIASELTNRTGASYSVPQTLDMLFYARKRGMLARLRRNPR